jgi:hypothetical protein
MPESGLSLTYPDLLAATGYEYGHGRDASGWDAKQLALIDETIHSAYRRVLGAYDWSFLKPTVSIKARAEVTGTLNSIPTRLGDQYIFNATTSIFTADMVGETLPIVANFDDTGYRFTITEYISGSRVKVQAAANQPALEFGSYLTGTAEAIEVVDPYTAVTGGTDSFYDDMVGDTLNFTSGSPGASYTISRYVSDAVAHVYGDASSETDTATFDVERPGTDTATLVYSAQTGQTNINVAAGSMFAQRMEDDSDTIVFTGTSNSYPIVDFVDVHNVRVTGDITGTESQGDTITVKHGGTATDVGDFVSGSRITATQSIFTDDMDDNAMVIVFDATAGEGNSYTIIEWVDAYTVIVDGDASAESGAFSIVQAAGKVSGQITYDSGQSTLDATASIFATTMRGMTVRFVTSGRKYTISSYTDADTVKLLGNAGSENSNEAVYFWVIGASDIASASTFTLENTGGTYALPDDFGGFVGRITFDEDDLGSDIEIVSDQQILRRRQHSTAASRPTYAARRVKASDGTIGQRYELLLWPDSDATYTLYIKYRVIPRKLTSSEIDENTPDAPYPIGGMFLSEVILASCRAVAEERMNNVRGPMYEAYAERLAAAIEYDKQVSTPYTAGYVGDPSTTRHLEMDLRLGTEVTHTGDYYGS